MNAYFNAPLNVLRISSKLLWIGLAMLVIGAVGAYGFDTHFSLAPLVMLHAMVILGPTTIKIGYVMRLLAQHQLSDPHARYVRAHAA
ncbi:transmembrane sensor/regulator PpyR [Pseudomonas sp. NA-150]|uniref:transmembrane sensor/regulator PpyR n=1 Tax=Pseudomonas sp. NA-150 TaxID=3367525 RepID=UPI0037C9F2EB